MRPSSLKGDEPKVNAIGGAPPRDVLEKCGSPELLMDDETVSKLKCDSK